MKAGRLVALLVIVGMVIFLLWSTLGSQRATCRVCAEYGGARNCATASAASRAEAARAAQSTACGTIARGMNESIACENRPPVSGQCQDRR